MIIFAIVVFTVSLILHTYPLMRIASWLFSLNFLSVAIVFTVAVVLSALILMCRILDNPSIAKPMMEVSNYLLGFFIYLFLFVLLLDLSRLFLPISNQLSAYGSIFLALGTSVLAGYLFLSQFKVVEHQIESLKITKPYTVIQITDTQFGTLNKKDLEKIATKVNQVLSSQKIDALLFTGDIIDTQHYNYEDLKSLDFKGVKKYFSLGNHEFYHGSKILEIVADLGYEILRGEKTGFDEINIIGIDDQQGSDGTDWLKNNLKHNLIDKEKFNILLYHRPTEVRVAKESAIDLMLTGHTHGGQIFPITLILKLIYDFPQGLVQLDNFYLYTSDGAGLWGPKMRLGTSNEITVFHLYPQK